ncbi:MAG: hypothetical protein ACJ8FV_00615 [Xanthobacteraceae bacterium]
MASQVNDMIGVQQRKPPRLSVELFRRFLDSRPDEEHWELIAGVAMMMAPPTVAHHDLLELPDFGLRCRIGALYRGTAIQPSNSQR